MTTETTTRTVTIDYDNEGRICREITITTVEMSPGAGRGATDARIVRFLEEQASLGRDGRYEIWADKQRPQHVITLGDLRALVAPPEAP